MTSANSEIVPRSVEQDEAVPDLNATVSELTPTPPVPAGGGFFNPAESGDASTLRMRIAKFLGGDAAVVDALASQSAFTNDDFERKNQERVRAFVAGPPIPYGGGDFSMAPPITHYNADRLNAGEPLRLGLSNPVVRGLGNRLALYGGGDAWPEMSRVMTSTAATDPAGFAQTEFTGRYFSAADPTTWRPARGGMDGGGYLYGVDGSGAGADPNSGAAFDAHDGAAGGELALDVVNTRTEPAFSALPPSGAGALAEPNAYGAAALPRPRRWGESFRELIKK